MSTNNNAYIKSFDGIRVVAVVAVVLYHLLPFTFKGGYLGVVIFFVMAGFLSMEKAKAIGVSSDRKSLISKSILDKIYKLYPAMLLMIVVVSIITVVFFRQDFVYLADDIKGALLSFNNYFQIFSGKSYFETMGVFNPFTHLWALSLEMQFYLLMFLFFYGGYSTDRKGKWITFLVIITIFSYAFSYYLLYISYDFTRVYYGLGTRLYSFALGSLTSLISLKKTAKKFLKQVGSFILVVLIVASFFIFDADLFTFKYVFFTYSIVTALLLMLLKSGSGSIQNVLSSKLFVVISKRSYHIYLWHFPVIAVIQKVFAHSNISNELYYIIFFIVCIISTEISYRLVESLKGKLNVSKKGIMAIVSICLIFFVIPYQLVSVSSENQNELARMQELIKENEALQKKNLKTATAANEAPKDEKIDEKAEVEVYCDDDDITKNKASKIGSKNKAYAKEVVSIEEVEKTPDFISALDYVDEINKTYPEIFIDPSEYETYRETEIFLIGDSVALGSYGVLSTYMPVGIYDSAISRTHHVAYRIYSGYAPLENGTDVILALGSNGTISPKNVDLIREDLDGGHIILTTIVIPNKSLENNINKGIIEYANSYDNVHLVDWYGFAKSKPELFVSDNIHPSEIGRKAYAQIIMKKLIDVEKIKKN